MAVVAGSPRDYRDAHPSTALLIVEVADASLAFDRIVKARLYARSRIQEYWVLNLVESVLEVHRRPARDEAAEMPAQYSAVDRLASGDHVAPLARPERSLPVRDLLP